MAFKKPQSALKAPPSPRQLFDELAGKSIERLLPQQEDILALYDGHRDKPDVALQLPTGSGKTLVGLLIAEWRRRSLSERALFLCPTNQLVHQVVRSAREKYGIEALAFTGSARTFLPGDKSKWRTGEAIGVTSYSSLFNVNPFFTSPSLIVLDDTHAAEQYIARCWSIEIERSTPLFRNIAAVIAPCLSSQDQQKILEAPSRLDDEWVDLLPYPEFVERSADIIAAIDESCADGPGPNPSLFFAWQTIRDHLSACQFYISADRFLVRPVLPPTSSHAPFADATQRIYMSATLGAGGELERLTGRSKILRLKPRSDEFQRHGIGRRFFIFPEMSLDQSAVGRVVEEAIRKAQRALWLVPNNQTARKINEDLASTLPMFRRFDARSLENDKSEFVRSEKAVAVVANRYDGIDFKDDECRLLIVQGIQTAVNLQEQFMYSRLRANLVLSERLVSRIVQAFGRCTRSPDDYATVIVLGGDVNKHILRKDERKRLPPSMQVEIHFGMAQSDYKTDEELAQLPDNLLDSMGLFLAQGPEWREVEKDDIVGLREDFDQNTLPEADSTANASTSEVAYQQAAWNDDWLKAYRHAEDVLATLNHSELKGYRAWWHYLAGCAVLANGDVGAENGSRRQFEVAAKSFPSLRWMRRISRASGLPAVDDWREDGSGVLVDRMINRLESLGLIHSRRFAREVSEIQKLIESDHGLDFEAGHERLGSLLGFVAGNDSGQATPDPWWIVDSKLCIVFEDYSESTETSRLSASKARQAATHQNWIRDHRARLQLDEDTEIVSVLVSARCDVAPEAAPHLRQVLFWETQDFREWASRALRTVQELRTEYQTGTPLAWRQVAIERYRSAELDPQVLLRKLRSHSPLTASD